MATNLRTVVTFKSAAFNATESKSYFINPGCFGDDVVEWMIVELRNRGVKTDAKPGQEDFGWYFDFEVAGTAKHTFVIAYRPDDITWIGWIERSRGFAGSILGARKRGIDPRVLETLHGVLSSSAGIKEIRWHFQRDFNKGQEENEASTP